MKRRLACPHTIITNMDPNKTGRLFSLLVRSVKTINTRGFHQGITNNNRYVVLRSRPGVCGAPCADNFSCELCEDVQEEHLQDGQVLIKTCYLSVDPAQRCQMNETTGADYVPPWDLGARISGLAGVGSVVASRHPSYSMGDLLYGSPSFPWTEYFVENMDSAADNYTQLDKTVFGSQPSLSLSLLGIAGLTAYFGLTEKGNIKKGHSCVVSGAAGSCGSVAGQVARLLGCGHVVGVCGSAEKCNWLTEDLGFDTAICYRTEDVGARLREACPDGVDVYFDNVGGPISDSVIEQMNENSNIVLCGQIALYNQDTPHVPPLPDHVASIVKQRNIKREEYLVLDFTEQFPEALAQLQKWHSEGHIKVRETVERGLENVGRAFCRMMAGHNIGKQVVHVSDP